MVKKRQDTFSGDLFVEPAGPTTEPFESLDPKRFPLNVGRQRVRDVVLEDLKGSKSPLIVTGYASLDQIIDLIPGLPLDSKVRVLFGNEPFPSKRKSFRVRGKQLPDEVRDYWLREGISAAMSAKLLQCLDRLEAGHVEARYLSKGHRQLHAKIYIGEAGATVGSSNFTRAGLEWQIEANARFAAVQEPKRYRELCSIAERYWSDGEDYTTALIELLRSLLRVVQWEEALARACAELLEGDWAKEFLESHLLSRASTLWPSQRQGIGQALYILSRQGSVLIADATGSGKTRLGVHLLHAVLNQILASSRARVVSPLMVCPPAVKENWQVEATNINTPLTTVSHGVLSRTGSRHHDRTLESLRQAQVLCVDEGHNFLNSKSNRTQSLLRNMADHVFIFTATPINRSANDLLRIVNLLGADNLEPATVEAFRGFLGTNTLNRPLTDPETDALREEIQKFTVRRTKPMLNALIDREPDAYRDAGGRRCRFPKHVPCVYSLAEPQADRTFAKEIQELAGDLYAVASFRKPFVMPEILRQQGWSEQAYLDNRVKTAQRLARYLIMALLRSSRLALGEHIIGTDQVSEDFELEFKKSTRTGNVLADVSNLGGKLPKNRLSVALPDWLSDRALHLEACAHDAKIYGQIYDRVRRMSDSRERAKAARLVELSDRHSLLLGFDRSQITLAEIARQIRSIVDNKEVLIATSEASQDRSRVLKEFQWGSESHDIIALCSDSLSEGVNLQQASCLLHLDMPSVVRIAEQRAGRVDRMDSPHSEIECWWPQDAPEFALSSDDRFLERYEMVDKLLGSNLPLPESMRAPAAQTLSAKELIQEFEENEESARWDGIHDAFEPVRAMVEGPKVLINAATYAEYRRVAARVQSRVSVVRSRKPWAFFCLRGGPFGAPRWVLFPGANEAAITELNEICNALRKRLTDDVEDLEMDATAAAELVRFTERLSAVEREILPRRKQRALEQMERVLTTFRESAGQRQEFEAFKEYESILSLFSQKPVGEHPDWDDLASRWLEVIRPVWYERLGQPGRKLLTLKDIERDLIEREGELRARILDSFIELDLPAAEERISAGILGVFR